MKSLKFIIFLLLCSCLAYGQGGVPSSPIVIVDSLGRPRAGVTVTVCTSGGTGTPCTPLASIFTDAGLTIPATNPTTTDGLGNLPVFYAAPGTYKYSVTGIGITPSGPFTATVAGTGGGNVLSGSPNHFTAVNTFGNINNLRVVDGTQFTTIQSAITDAGTAGAVEIPATYAGTDTFTNPNTIPIVDYRNKVGLPGSLGIYSTITSSVPGFTPFPEGGDLGFWHMGPADMYLSGTVVSTTTTASLIVGANTNVLVAAVTNGSLTTGTTSLFATPALMSLSVRTGTGTAENLQYNATANCPTASTWNIVDATHMCLNTANTHSGTTTISQGPGTIFETFFASINANNRTDNDLNINLDSGTGVVNRAVNLTFGNFNVDTTFTTKWTVGQDASKNFFITESLVNGTNVLPRFVPFANGATRIQSDGTNAVTINDQGNANTGTGGLIICNGGATPTCGAGITSSGAGGTMAAVIASGTATMTTAAIASLACGATVTVSATNVVTTDAIMHSFNAAPAANPGELTLNSWPTANNVNFEYCNPTAGSVTPNAATLNWRVVR